jgi:hypothetical protein
MHTSQDILAFAEKVKKHTADYSKVERSLRKLHGLNPKTRTYFTIEDEEGTTISACLTGLFELSWFLLTNPLPQQAHVTLRSFNRVKTAGNHPLKLHLLGLNHRHLDLIVEAQLRQEPALLLPLLAPTTRA